MTKATRSFTWGALAGGRVLQPGEQGCQVCGHIGSAKEFKKKGGCPNDWCLSHKENSTPAKGGGDVP